MIDSSTIARGLTHISLIWDVLELLASFIVTLMFVPLCSDFMLVGVLMQCVEDHLLFTHVPFFILFSALRFNSNACMLHLTW